MTNTEITPEVIEQVVTLANQLTLHDVPASGFRRLIPGILAATLYQHIADYGRRYDNRQMDVILELAGPHIALKGTIIADLRRDWATLFVYNDVMRGVPHPGRVRLTDVFLSGGPVIPEARRILTELEEGAV